MSLDPFSTTKPKSSIKRQPQNFVEALKSIGGHTLDSVNRDVLRGFGNDTMNAVFGRGSSQSLENPYNNLEWVREKERDSQLETERLLRHKEVQQTALYDRREEEIKAQIKALQTELKALAHDMAQLSLTTQKAVQEQIAHPGKYHINYLEKLRRFIVNLRKQVQDANIWLEASYQRRQAKQFYWGGVKKSGTKFMLSQERTVATSAG